MPMTEDQIKVVVQARSLAKGSLTRVRFFLTGFNKATQAIEQLTVRRTLCGEIWKKYDDSQSVLELEDPNMYERDRETFEALYLDTLAQIEKLMNEMLAPSSNRRTSTASATSNNTTSNQTSSDRVNIKLPQIELPNFSGKYEDWKSFIDIFDSIVHENPSLREVQKLQYLKMAVVGDAGALIKSLKSTADHYERARDILFKNFDKKQYIVDAHLKALFNHNINVKNDLRKLVSYCTQHVNALKALDLTHQQLWEQTLIFIIKQRIDFRLNQDWELDHKDKNALPQLDKFFSFMDSRCFESTKPRDPPKGSKVHAHLSTNNTPDNSKGNNLVCSLCKTNGHRIYQCPKLLAESVEERITTIKTLNLCLNCLRSGHKVQDCQSQHCKYCSRKHNTLLHLVGKQNPTVVTPAILNQDIVDQASTQTTTHICQSESKSNNMVLLGTAVILTLNAQEQWIPCRALLDSGSQANFITQRFLTKLNGSVDSINLSILGVNHTKTKAIGKTTLSVKSRLNDRVHRLDFIVLPCVTVNLPGERVCANSWPIPPNLQLADPQFQEPIEIDMLIGAELYSAISEMEQIRLGGNLPVLQRTQFGWIISGRINNQSQDETVCCSSTISLEQQLVKFWTLEEFSNKPPLTKDEKFVENHFVTTHKRNGSGRFVVQLPKQLDVNLLGDSYKHALQRFLKLETRFKGDARLKEQYTQFIEEYEVLDHMEEVTNIEEIQKNKNYYLPHHAVIKNTSVTTKTRVVFDASAKTTSGLSLNDVLMVGPTIQHDVFTILTRFRQHKYVLTTDIVKMYRQIQVSEEDTNLQLILWRDNPNMNIKTYRLKTVTYGTASAPFLAIRCLQQLAQFHDNKTVQRIIREDFYVDDVLTGSDDLNELLETRNQIIQLLNSGGFMLDKWASNDPSLLEGLSTTNSVIIFDKSDMIKTLGVHWLPQADVFCIQIPEIDSSHTSSTKRDILSFISKMFDPLGFLSPIIINAKVLMQHVWELHISWDDIVPVNIQLKWNQFCSELNLLNELQISRHIIIEAATHIEIHGFADASELAYGAAVYMRSRSSSGRIHSSLIASKSRVAPLKRSTIPRLELCAAHLLAKLYNKVSNSFVNLPIKDSYLWSDSTIVLCWLQKSSRNLKTFVSSRVSEIQELTNGCHWRHVNSNDNPADAVSRGLTPKELLNCSL